MISGRQVRRRSMLSTMLLLSLVVLGAHAAKDATTTTVEPKTGIEFSNEINKRTKLTKLGVRTKGPLKLYAVGMYGDSSPLFVLKMKMGVSAEKISGALADALRPRCLEHSVKDKNAETTCAEKISTFKDLILNGLPGKSGAKKGTTLAFGTSGGKISVTINDKSIGSVPSKPLAKAFAGIYTDKNAVCVLHAVDGSDDGASGAGFPFDLDLDDPVHVATLVVGVITVLYVLSSIVRGSKPSQEPKGISVCELNVYPIKSCAEQRVQSAVATASGFVGDRMAMVVDDKGVCCTARTPAHAKLFKIVPQYNDDTKNITIGVSGRSILASIQVDTTTATRPQGSDGFQHNEAPGTLALDDYGNEVAAWLTKQTGIPGGGVRLTGIGSAYQRNVAVNPAQGDAVPVKSGAPVSLADEAPYLLTNEASLADLNRRLQKRGKDAVDMRRFRPNIVVRGRDVKAWEEDTWKKIRIGKQVEFFVWQRCGRCTMTTIDRDSLERCGEPLSTLSTFRERKHGMRNFGMHLVPDPATLSWNPHENVISEHDVVVVLEYDGERLEEWQASTATAAAF